MIQKNKLFSTLESILGVATDIYTMTQNQETVIMHGGDAQMLSQLAGNKQQLIIRLNQLETQFQFIYEENKEIITHKEDVARLQGLVSQVVETKASIARAEEKNRRLWASKDQPKVKARPVQQPKAYVIDQYKKYSKK